MASAQEWTQEEQRVLRRLTVDPVKNDRQKLVSLVRHFKGMGRKKPGGIWSVTDGAGSGELRVSPGLARKVRDLAQQGKLDWVLDTGGEMENAVQPSRQASRATCRITKERAAALAHTFSQLMGLEYIIENVTDLRSVLSKTAGMVARDYSLGPAVTRWMHDFSVEDDPAGQGYVISGNPHACDFAGQLIRGEAPYIPQLEEGQST